MSVIKEFTGSPQQIEFVFVLADQVYREVANKYELPANEPIYKGTYCRDASDLLISKLRGEDYQAFSRYYYERRFSHCHIDLGNGWRADPAWQQFLEFYSPFIQVVKKRTLFLPKVLIFKAASLPNALLDYGISSRHINYWTESKIEHS